jgi:hypothetical protein
MHSMEILKAQNSLKKIKRFRLQLVNKIFMVKECFNLNHQNKWPDKVILLTAASKTHERSLLNLLVSVGKYSPDITIRVWDLGMTKKALGEVHNLRSKWNIEIQKFDFANYPAWMNINSENKGAYAWKPQIVFQELLNFSNTPHENTVMFWADAGNLVVGKLSMAVKATLKYGFLATSSRGNIKDWTHPETLLWLDPREEYTKFPNLNAAFLGLHLNSHEVCELLEKWHLLSLDKSVISPRQANLTNHRFDQALLSLLAAKSKIFPKYALKRFDTRFLNVLCHQDVG